MTAAAPGPAAPEQAADPHAGRKRALGIGGATIAVGGAYVAARRLSVSSGHVKTLIHAGQLPAGPKVYQRAHPHVTRIATMEADRGAKLRALRREPDAMTELHKDLRSATPSKHALHLSGLMHPNGNTNPSIAHARGKVGIDVLHDPLGQAHSKDRVETTRAMIHHSDPAHTPELHRGMRGVEHQVGDVIDFGHYSSFTHTRSIAEVYAHQHGGAHAGVYRVAAGKTKAMPVDGAGNTSRNHEWLAGGKFRVAGKRTATSPHGTPVHHYELEPHDSGISKAFGWSHGQTNTTGYHWLRDGMKVGANPRRPAIDRDVRELASNIKPNHARAFTTGVKVGRVVSHPATPVATAAGGVATAVAVVHHQRAGNKEAAMSGRMHKSAFGVVHKAEDGKRHTEEAAAATGGVAASTGAYQAGGYKMKLVAQRQGAKVPVGISRSKYEKTIKAHQRAHGAYHGGPPQWLGQRGRTGHTIGLITGQGPTAHVQAARHWPTKVQGVSVPGARARRVMGYTHGGKTGLAVGGAAAAAGGASAFGIAHHLTKPKGKS